MIFFINVTSCQDSCVPCIIKYILETEKLCLSSRAVKREAMVEPLTVGSGTIALPLSYPRFAIAMSLSPEMRGQACPER